MAQFISIPGVDGQVEYMKRQPDLAQRVVNGPEVVDWLQQNENWKEIQEMKTVEFVDYVVRPKLNEEKPRFHAFLEEPVTAFARRNVGKDPKNSSSSQILGFKPGFFQKKSAYGGYDKDYNFISHVWSMPVKHLLGYLGSTHLHNWCDIFAVSQLPGAEQNADLRNLTEAVYGAAEMKVLVDRSGVCFTRIWCLFEMVTRVRSGRGLIKFIVPEVLFELGVFRFNDLDAEQRRIYWRESAKILEGVLKKGINCLSAQSSIPKDRERILNWIENDVGTDRFNTQISQLVRDEIMRLRMVAGPINVADKDRQKYLEALEHFKDGNTKS